MMVSYQAMPNSSKKPHVSFFYYFSSDCRFIICSFKLNCICRFLKFSNLNKTDLCLCSDGTVYLICMTSLLVFLLSQLYVFNSSVDCEILPRLFACGHDYWVACMCLLSTFPYCKASHVRRPHPLLVEAWCCCTVLRACNQHTVYATEHRLFPP